MMREVNKLKITLDRYYNFEEREDRSKLSIDDVKALLVSGASLADRLRDALKQGSFLVKVKN